MATDLSKIIQEGLSSTLIALLGRDTTFDETTKVDQRDIDSFELIQINAEFNFDKLVTVFKFFIPANSASIIFNTLMSAEEYDIDSTIDDDTSDAISEFISNLSGGLESTFNKESTEELGQTKFHIQHKEILKGEDLTNLDNFYRFSLHIEDKNIVLFIHFEENFIPFIPEIANSEITYHPPEPERREKREIKDDSIDKDKIQNSEDEKIEDKESSKLKKYLTKKNIILASSATLLIVILVVVLLSGSNEEEEPPKEKEKPTVEEPKKEEVKQIETKPLKTLKKVDFKINDIDRARLNKRLATLTKHQILSDFQIKEQERLENERLEKLYKEKELMEFAKQNKEEPVILPTAQEENTEENTQKSTEEKTTATASIENQENSTNIEQQQALYYITTHSIKYTLYKNLITQNNSTTARISVCNNKNGKTTIFIGPFETDTLQMKMKTLIENKEPQINTSLLTLTPEEFDKQCNL